MQEGKKQKLFTVDDIHEALIPAMEEIFATKKDLNRFATKEDLMNFATQEGLDRIEKKVDKFDADLVRFKNETLTSFDRVFKDLETLKIEKTMGYE